MNECGVVECAAAAVWRLHSNALRIVSHACAYMVQIPQHANAENPNQRQSKVIYICIRSLALVSSPTLSMHKYVLYDLINEATQWQYLM